MIMADKILGALGAEVVLLIALIPTIITIALIIAIFRIKRESIEIRRHQEDIETIVHYMSQQLEVTNKLLSESMNVNNDIKELTGISIREQRVFHGFPDNRRIERPDE